MSLARWVEAIHVRLRGGAPVHPDPRARALVGFWFGYEFLARVIVCVLIACSRWSRNTLFGLQSVDKSQRELFRLQKPTSGRCLTKLTLPAALPSIFVGMRTSAGLSVIGAIVGDYFFRRGEPGIGSLIANYRRACRAPNCSRRSWPPACWVLRSSPLVGGLSKVAVGRWYDSTI